MSYRSITDLNEIKELLRGKSPVAFDFETSAADEWRSDSRAALDAHKSVIAGVSFSFAEGDAFYVPLTHRCGRNAGNQDELWAFLKEEIFESGKVFKVAHNLSFESMFLYAKGITVQMPCYDTIAAAQLTLKSRFEFRNLHDSGLKLLSTALFGADMPSFEAVTAGRFFDEMNPQDKETIRYACADSDYTLRLYRKFNNWFDKYMPNHRGIAELLESPTAVYVGMMKYNGVPVDTDAMERAKIKAEVKINELAGQITDLIGDVEIGSNCSTAAFKNYLYKTRNLPVLKQTDKFLPSVDDEALIRLKEYCARNKPELAPLFDMVLEYRKWQKLNSTYFSGYLSCVNPATNRIHPDLMPLATETGRFACRKPNMQNSPQPGQDPVGVRNFITAPEGSGFEVMFARRASKPFNTLQMRGLREFLLCISLQRSSILFYVLA
jgi:DNA polymerase I